jgi:hypothetical protein
MNTDEMFEKAKGDFTPEGKLSTDFLKTISQTELVRVLVSLIWDWEKANDLTQTFMEVDRILLALVALSIDLDKAVKESEA